VTAGDHFSGRGSKKRNNDLKNGQNDTLMPLTLSGVVVEKGMNIETQVEMIDNMLDKAVEAKNIRI
jgi:hypothetical protein